MKLGLAGRDSLFDGRYCMDRRDYQALVKFLRSVTLVDLPPGRTMESLEAAYIPPSAGMALPDDDGDVPTATYQILRLEKQDWPAHVYRAANPENRTCVGCGKKAHVFGVNADRVRMQCPHCRYHRDFVR